MSLQVPLTPDVQYAAQHGATAQVPGGGGRARAVRADGAALPAERAQDGGRRARRAARHARGSRCRQATPDSQNREGKVLHNAL